MSRGVHIGALALLLTAGAVTAESPVLISTSLKLPDEPVNWSGDFAPCLQRNELRRYDYMDLGVRFSTSNRMLAKSFRRALDFWSKILTMKWHEDETSSCALQIVDGTASILSNEIVARSQFTDWGGFQGWIAFDPHAPLTRSEMYVTAVHEIGHMLGLKHNPNSKSVMYYLDLEGPEVLDAIDLVSLAERHRLRPSGLKAPISVTAARF